MRVPISEMVTVVSYLLKQKLAGRERFPMVLMLEPLYRCNLACAGCGKIQYPSNILKSHLSYDECMKAVDECPAPIVSLPGGELIIAWPGHGPVIMEGDAVEVFSGQYLV